MDRLSVVFPVSDFERDSTGWDGFQVKGPGTDHQRRLWSGSVEVVSGVRAFVGVSEVPDHPQHRWWGKVELNPSRVVDPEGCSVAPVGELPGVMRRAARAASGLVAPVVSLAEFRVSRLDVARDFSAVDEVSSLIGALGAVHRPWSRRHLVHADPKRNGAQTLMVGSGAGVVRLYDKAAETKGKAALGTLRWEAECREWADRYGSVRSLRDVTGENVEALCRDRWEWSAMGTEVAGDLGRLVHSVGASGLSAAHQRAFLGWLVEQAAGVERSAMSQTTLAKYRRLQRELGIAAPAELRGTIAVLRRLDFDSGREVVRVA